MRCSFLCNPHTCWACFTPVANNVFKAKNDPFKKEGPKKEAEDKSSEKRTSAGMRLTK